MRKAVLLLICLMTILLSGCTTVNFSDAYYGMLNLSDESFDDSTLYKMRGEWKIVWNEYIDPTSTFDKKADYIDLINVPQTWTNKSIGQSEVGSQGYGTLILDILTPDNVTNLAIESTYVTSAFEMYADGKLIASNGQIGKSKSTTTAQWKPVVGHFKSKENKTRVVIHFSNFHHRRFVIKDLYIGTDEAVNKHVTNRVAYDLLTAGGIFIMALYHFMIYYLHKRDTAAMYFSLLCLSFSLRSLMVGNRYIYDLIPNLDWEIFMKMAYIAFYLVGLFAVLFVSHTFRKYHRSYIDKIMFIGTCLAVLMTILFPAHIFDRLLIPYEVLLLMGIAYVTYIIYNALKFRESGAVVMMLGIVILTFCGFNDMLYEAGIIGTTSMTPYGLLALVVCQSSSLAQRYTFAYNTAESLLEENAVINGKLSEHNDLLEDLISQRTHELHDVNEELQTSNEELVELVEAINRSEAHFRSLFENIPIGVFRYGNKSGFKMVNPKMAEVLGFESAHTLSKALKTHNYKMISNPTAWAEFKAKLTASDSTQILREVEMVRKDGKHIITELTFGVVEKIGDETFAEGTLTDISKRIELKNKLEILATTDSLTGLWNRRAFTEKMANLRESVWLSLVDIDDFKTINDTYGHDTGDHVLQKTAEILKSVCSKDNFIARVGGEEFAILFTNSDHNQVIRCLEKLRVEVEHAELDYMSNKVNFTISIGLSSYDDIDLFRQADKMLYRAKYKGKNRIQTFIEESS